MVKRKIIDVLTNGRWRRAVAIAGLAAMLPPTVLGADPQDTARDWAFVHQVLLSYEHREGQGNIYRWTRSPTYFAYLETPNQIEAARRAVVAVNQVIEASGIQATLKTKKRDDFDALIGVIAQSGMSKIWRAAGCGGFFKYAVDGATCVHVESDTDEIDAVFILIDAAQDEVRQESALLEEVYQSFGVRNDHQIYKESLTYDGPDRIHRTMLAPIDKKVLIFLYKYLEPGDDEATVRRKFDAHWHKIVVE